ncbi:MAG: DUF1244 domain-containing protein, partial [Tateyamaria sp.]
MDDQTRIAPEAAAVRRLPQHLMEDRTAVQHNDMLNPPGSCSNCES